MSRSSTDQNVQPVRWDDSSYADFLGARYEALQVAAVLVRENGWCSPIVACMCRADCGFSARGAHLTPFFLHTRPNLPPSFLPVYLGGGGEGIFPSLLRQPKKNRHANRCRQQYSTGHLYKKKKDLLTQAWFLIWERVRSTLTFGITAPGLTVFLVNIDLLFSSPLFLLSVLFSVC